jgi:2Fe-2S ferredoxin
LGDREDDEQELLEDLDSFKEDQSRLSCQIEFSEEMDGMRVEIASDE